MSWTIILLIIITGALAWFIMPYISMLYGSLRAKKIGINFIFLNSYNFIKKRMNDTETEEFAITNAFSGIQQRPPFNILSAYDISQIIKTLEPFGSERPVLFAALIFIADCVNDATFLRNPKQIIYELIQHQEHFQKKNNISTDTGITPLLKIVYTQKYNKQVADQADKNQFHSQLPIILNVLSQLEIINNEHYKIHNDLFNNPNQNVFVPIDMGKHLLSNTEQLKRLNEIRNQTKDIKRNENPIPSEFDLIIVTFEEFIDTFNITLQRFNKMLNSLFEKSKSFKNSNYDLKQYQRDLTDYKIAEQKYQYLKIDIDEKMQALMSKSSFN